MSQSPEGEPTPDEGHDQAEDLGRRIAEGSGIHRTAAGQVDVLKTVGGVRGLIEALLPGIVFLVVFMILRELNPALISSLAIAAIFTVARLVRKTGLTQALTGLFGVLICAVFARTTGNARDFYVPGFYTNGAYLLGFVISIVVRWPLMGLVFGFIRGEGVDWRTDRARRFSYAVATWIIAGVMGARLLVQLPLYAADNIEALGAARIVMGIPLYAMGLWLAWLVSRPATVGQTQPEAPSAAQD
ncbi:DUF3159 domain-containing protein [Arthrobacter rhombi]|uniref:DUF3159 domain-containing protein n=1 Tax=Arthrobacter rhombi TaxID=71253 RepID=UPI003FD1FEC1